MIEAVDVDCPYCGEIFSSNVDCSAGSQSYIEDCLVCCRPIEFHSEVDSDGQLVGVSAKRDDE